MTPTPKLFNSTTPSKVPPCSHRSCGRVPAVENKEHRCLTCHVSYCSHGCRRSDSRRHGKICKQLAEGVERPDAWEPSMPCNEPRLSKWSPPKGLEAPISIPFTRLWLGTWLHGRPEQDVYRILVDTYRLRMDDVFVTTQKAEEDSIYSGRVTGLSGFHRFMGIAAAKEGLLPPWWDEDSARKCGRIGLPAVGLPHYFCNSTAHFWRKRLRLILGGASGGRGAQRDGLFGERCEPVYVSLLWGGLDKREKGKSRRRTDIRHRRAL